MSYREPWEPGLEREVHTDALEDARVVVTATSSVGSLVLLCAAIAAAVLAVIALVLVLLLSAFVWGAWTISRHRRDHP